MGVAADGVLEVALAQAEGQVDAALMATASVTRELRKAGGHPGWVVLFDEVELIGRYSLLRSGAGPLPSWHVGSTGTPLRRQTRWSPWQP